jgi:hypothetical protein
MAIPLLVPDLGAPGEIVRISSCRGRIRGPLKPVDFPVEPGESIAWIEPTA